MNKSACLEQNDRFLWMGYVPAEDVRLAFELMIPEEFRYHPYAGHSEGIPRI